MAPMTTCLHAFQARRPTPASTQRPRLPRGAGLLLGIAISLAAFVVHAGQAVWRPTPGARFDIQLTAPYDLARGVDMMALEPFGTPPERVAQLHARRIGAVCYLAAGTWQNWRPDAAALPAAVLGRGRSGRPGERWLDVRAQSVLDVLGARLDLCRDRGFDGVLFGDVEAYAQVSGFPITAEQQLAFNRKLAKAAHSRGLAAGLMNDLGQAGDLVGDFDFLVADECVARGDCHNVQPFLGAAKPVHLIAYTNQPGRITNYCALAAGLGAPLILKTQSLNGKLHRRC